VTGPSEDYPAVRVHLAGVEPGVALGAGTPPAARRKIVTRFGTETANDVNPIRPLLPRAEERLLAIVQATGGDVYLCDSESKAKQGLGSLLSSSSSAPWPLLGTQPVWIAQVTGGKTCTVAFTAEYSE
jgi:hypothetical protein